MNQWNTIKSFTQTGVWHREDNLCCQDAIASIQNGKVTVIALADGTGRTDHAYAGAQKTAVTSAQILAEYFDDLYHMDRSLASMEVIIRIKDSLHELTEKDGCNFEELSSTMLAAAVSDDKYFLLHLGDGCMFGQFEDDTWKMISAPENGIRKNETVLTTSYPAAEHVRIRRGDISDLKSICLCSDGWRSGMDAIPEIQKAMDCKHIGEYDDDVSVIMMKKQ